MGLGQGDRGYAMAALLVGMSITAVLMSAAMPVWSQFAKREREAELIWRGEQYARAVGLFQRKYANTFPPTVDILVEQRFLRKKYKDPVTGEDFQPIPAGGGMPPGSIAAPGSSQVGQQFQGRPNGVGQFGQSGAAPGQPPRPGQQGGGVAGATQPSIGIQGVVSKSTDTALKLYNGRSKYNEWSFVYLASVRQLAPGANQERQGAQPPGGPRSPFQSMGGTERRPGVDGQPPGFPGSRPDMPRQPGPFGPPPPFGPSGPTPSRPPGN